METGPLFYVVIRGTWRSKHLQVKGSTFISQLFKDNGYWSGPMNPPNASPVTPMKSKLSTPKSKYSQLLPYGHPNNTDNSEIPCKNILQMFDWNRLPLLRTLAKEEADSRSL